MDENVRTTTGPRFDCKPWVGGDYHNPELQSQLDDLTQRVARTVSALNGWHALWTLGYFKYLPSHAREIVEKQATAAMGVLEAWNRTGAKPPTGAHERPPEQEKAL